MTESKLQQDIYNFFHNTYCLKHHNPRCMIFAVPNGGTRNAMEAITLKATGLLAGVSDLIVIIPNKILFVELKTEIGIQSEVQKDFQSRIELLGYEYHLIRSLTAFQELFK